MAVPILAPEAARSGIERLRDWRRDRHQAREDRRRHGGPPASDGAEDEDRPRPTGGRIDVVA